MQTKEKQQKKSYLITTVGVIILLILMASSSVLFAQAPGGRNDGQQGPPPIPNSKQIKKMVGHLTEEISLNEEQSEQVLAIYKNHFEEVKEATSTGRPDRSKMEKLKTKMEKDVKAILSKEQQEGFETFLNEQQKKRRRERPE